MRINKHDTDGIKPLLQKGELGYDDYTSGGDVGRVYVGTGAANIALGKKSEIDTHTARVDNPHSVTKTQVGLGNVDDTADSVKVVASASKWTTGRDIALAGVVTGTVNVDGSANVSITTSVGTSLQTTLDSKVERTSATGSAKIPSGTTAQRDASPIDGMIRYNSTLKGFEGYFNGTWQSVGGGQMFGNAVTKAVSYNAQTISENIDVTAGVNAYSVGDVTIANGYTLTIANGSIYKIL